MRLADSTQDPTHGVYLGTALDFRRGGVRRHGNNWLSLESNRGSAHLWLWQKVEV